MLINAFLNSLLLCHAALRGQGCTDIFVALENNATND